ncbi:hypothetical protein, partial [Escherichia coli]|uniref:hypothetical protein n=1 Tax=Escherichia coli TaxID=562 RepID=UPI001114E342
TGGTADRNRSHWSTSKTPSYTKSVSWQHHQESTKRSEITKPSCGGFFRRLIERDSDARYSQALQFSM